MSFWANRNLFIVLSPLQLICAQEAREAFCLGEKNHLIIIDRNGPGSPEYTQKNNELDDGWHRVSRHSEPRRRGATRLFIRIFNTFSIVLHHGVGKGKVFLGDPYLNWFRYLGKTFGKEVVWLDDGAASINVIHNFRERGLLTGPNATTPKFFSIFSSEKLESLTNGAIQKNELKLLRQSRRSGQKILKNKAIFIGQWLSERGGVDQEAELGVLRAACADMTSLEIDYIAHRHENEEKLAQIAKIMNVVRYDRSIEATLLDVDVLPVMIMSWYSTAMFTLQRLFPESQYAALQVPLDGASEKQKVEWQRVYAAMADLGIEIRDYTNARNKDVW